VTDRTPIPVEELISTAIDDGSDYHDGFDGYLSHTFDTETGVLEVKFERTKSDAADPFGPFDPDHGDANYRFKLLGDGEETAAEVIEQAVTYINYCREEGEGDLRSIRDWLTSSRANRLADIAEIEAGQ
jgi:hypothetical protein